MRQADNGLPGWWPAALGQPLHGYDQAVDEYGNIDHYKDQQYGFHLGAVKESPEDGGDYDGQPEQAQYPHGHEHHAEYEYCEQQDIQHLHTLDKDLPPGICPVIHEYKMSTALEDTDLDALRDARSLLENPGLAALLSNRIGTPIEKGLQMLPAGWSEKIGRLTQSALHKAIDAAIYTLNDRPGNASSNRLHKFGAAISGGVGGFFGLPGLTVELPVATTLMMRSIADIARSEGESLASEETRKACLEVFALGGRTKTDDASESGYYAIRFALAQSVSQATTYLGGGVMAEKGVSPAMVRFISAVADRFGVQVSEKAAAQSMPALGAAGGALINTLFIDHFQNMARGHFTVRRLERKYDPETVRQAYESIGARPFEQFAQGYK